MTWVYQGKEITSEQLEGFFSFVYLITCQTNGRKYIGKKLLFFKGHKQVKGRKRRILKPSDWQDYYGSSNELLADLEKFGKDNFTREILHLCRNKGEATYKEAKEQFDRDALLRSDYFNSIINLRCNMSHLPKDMLIVV
jgi:hypothetical protein